MCGIAGMVDPRIGSEAGESLLARMLDSIRHRGPDASGAWVDAPVYLGNNRLAIIDLSESANQPMERGNLVIVHNGEIYNYLEVRAELEDRGHRFETQSDTEVVLAAYEEWGAECVQRFVGMWAFAIWDRSSRELFCSRDRFGIKPFYYIHAGDRFYFGSEYKPLKLAPVFSSELDLEQIERGFRLGGITFRDATYYRCIRALPERCNLLFRDGEVTVTRYWDVDTRERFRGGPEEKRARFRELFRDSIRLHMRSDVPVGGMLSGGMDSASIASFVGTEYPELPYRTYTIWYEGYRAMDERRWAQAVIDAYPSIEPTITKPTDDDIAGAYEKASYALDTPPPASTPIWCYLVMAAAAKDGLRVMLDGQGADEYLAGYDPAFDRHLAGHLRRGRLIRAARALAECRDARSLQAAATARVAATGAAVLLLGEQRMWAPYFHPSAMQFLRGDVPYQADRVPGSPLTVNLYNLTFGHFLPSLLHYGDRMSMAWSIESRVPFLDHRLVEFVFSLDDDDKIDRGERKYILRRAVEGTVPEAVLKRRDKQPFLGGETAAWLRGPLRHLTEMPLRFDDVGFFDNATGRRLIDEFKGGNDHVCDIVWTISSHNYWLNQQ